MIPLSRTRRMMMTFRNNRMMYLLRTGRQTAMFRTRYARFIEARSGAFRSWVRSLPLMEWSPLVIREGQEESVIGILCILYIEQKICISFSEDMQFIRNEPLDASEYQKWSDSFFKKTGRNSNKRKPY